MKCPHGGDKSQVATAQRAHLCDGSNDFQNEFSSVGNARLRTSELYLPRASRKAFPPSKYFLACLKSWEESPRRSCMTWIWPSQQGPAPIPIVGIVNSAVMSEASSPGMSSRTIENAPASSILFANSISRAPEGPLPCTLCPPNLCSDCGVNP